MHWQFCPYAKMTCGAIDTKLTVETETQTAPTCRQTISLSEILLPYIFHNLSYILGLRSRPLNPFAPSFFPTKATSTQTNFATSTSSSSQTDRFHEPDPDSNKPTMGHFSGDATLTRANKRNGIQQQIIERLHESHTQLQQLQETTAAKVHALQLELEANRAADQLKRDEMMKEIKRTLHKQRDDLLQKTGIIADRTVDEMLAKHTTSSSDCDVPPEVTTGVNLAPLLPTSWVLSASRPFTDDDLTAEWRTNTRKHRVKNGKHKATWDIANANRLTGGLSDSPDATYSTTARLQVKLLNHHLTRSIARPLLPICPRMLARPLAFELEQ